jgi:hypothetical protein
MSMSSTSINNQLESYGARTSGTLAQRTARLQRFKSSQTTPKKSRVTLAVPAAPQKAMLVPAIRVDMAENEYEELRILAMAAGMYDADEEDSDDSDYEPPSEVEEDSDDSVSLAPTEDDADDEAEMEDNITNTWQYYLQNRTITALSEFVQMVITFAKSQQAAAFTVGVSKKAVK